MSTKLNKDTTQVDGDIVTLKFHKTVIEDLIELMRFSRSAANLLIAQELAKGTIDGASKMKSYSDLSTDVIANLTAHLNMGEPLDGDLH
jgi:hypothetical protein